MGVAEQAIDSAPIGWLGYVGPDAIWGWSCDPDTPAQSIAVHLYAGNTFLTAVTANMENEAAVTTACGGGSAHRYKWLVPDWAKALLGNGDFPVYAYGINTSGAAGTVNGLLNGSPKTLHLSGPVLAVHKAYPYASWSPYCDMNVNNLCNVSALGRNCQTDAMWTQGYYDYQSLCNSNGGADYICTRGVNNLCNVPELGRQCAGDQWTEGFYAYAEICATRTATCGAQPQQLSGTLYTDQTSHPNARTSADYNLKVAGYHATGDAQAFSTYGGCADYSAPNLTDLWFHRNRPSPFFGQQYQRNQAGQPGALVTGLRFNPCEDVYLPTTGLPGQMGPSRSSCSGVLCKEYRPKGLMATASRTCASTSTARRTPPATRTTLETSRPRSSMRTRRPSPCSIRAWTVPLDLGTSSTSTTST